MKRIVIVDRRIDDNGTRHARLRMCLERLGAVVTCVPQVYGSPSRQVEPADFDEQLLELGQRTLGDADLILLHCGDRQHLVPQVLWQTFAVDLPCLLYTGLPKEPTNVSTFLASSRASPKHVVLPVQLPSTLPETWQDSSGAMPLRKCAELILSGTAPPDAVRLAFGAPRLDAILDALYGKMAAVSATMPPEELTRLLGEITNDRNARLEAFYREKRGW